MQTMVSMSEKAPRYYLMLETVEDVKYTYDINMGTFVRMGPKDMPFKAPLHCFDMITATFESREQMAQMYGINTPIKTMYVGYRLKGEWRLAPVFDNESWAKLAKSYGEINTVTKYCKRPKHVIDFRFYNNLDLFNDVYKELMDPNSEFADIIIKNKTRRIHLSQYTINALTNARAHEQAIRDKKKELALERGHEVELDELPVIYLQDRTGYYQELRNCVTSYREFRTLYLNYCKYKKDQAKKLDPEAKETKPLVGNVTTLKYQKTLPTGKKPIEKPEQLSFFNLIGE